MHQRAAATEPSSVPDLDQPRCVGAVPLLTRLLSAGLARCGVFGDRFEARSGINSDTIVPMAMTLRLSEQETEALRRRAELEGTSMQDVARHAVRDYIEQRSKRDLLDQVLDEELPRFAEALERLAR